jgi:hypothetical protein
MKLFFIVDAATDEGCRHRARQQDRKNATSEDVFSPAA